MFVALVLDNLELEEQMKIAKQNKQDKEVVQNTKKLPWRVRVFNLFKPKPLVVTSKPISGVENSTLVLRKTFADTFLEEQQHELDEVI